MEPTAASGFFAAGMEDRSTEIADFDRVVERYWPRILRFVLASVLGIVVKVFAFTYAGATMTERPGWLDALMLAGTFGIVALLPFVARWWRSSRATAVDAPPRT